MTTKRVLLGRVLPTNWFVPIRVSLILFTMTAFVADADDSTTALYVNGFGNLTAAFHDQADARLINNLGSFVDDQLGYEYDSKAGFQVNWVVNDRLNLVMQSLTATDTQSSIDTDIKNLYLQYRVSKRLSVRLGRFITPLYKFSEQQYVTFSQPWVRPPVELYPSASDFDFSDGVWLKYRFNSKQYTELEIFVSQLRQDEADISFKARQDEADISFEARPIVGTILNRSDGSFSYRFMAARAPIDFNLPGGDQLEAILNVPSAQRQYHADSIQWFYNIGIQYQHYPWSVVADVIYQDTDNYAYQRSLSTNLTLSYQLERVTPYLSWSNRRNYNLAAENGLQGEASLLANQLIENRKTDQMTLAVGARWGINDYLALKAQLDFIEFTPGHRGDFDRAMDDAQLTSLSLEWFF